MTREEAIQRLTDLQDGSGQTYEAIRMAIKALSAETVEGVGRYENAMQKLREMPRYFNNVKAKQIKKISADAVQGEWKIDEYGIYHCPFCYAINNTVYKSFCPNCGARLEANE